jgi:hypothetical protein
MSSTRPASQRNKWKPARLNEAFDDFDDDDDDESVNDDESEDEFVDADLRAEDDDDDLEDDDDADDNEPTGTGVDDEDSDDDAHGPQSSSVASTSDRRNNSTLATSKRKTPATKTQKPRKSMATSVTTISASATSTTVTQDPHPSTQPKPTRGRPRSGTNKRPMTSKNPLRRVPESSRKNVSWTDPDDAEANAGDSIAVQVMLDFARNEGKDKNWSTALFKRLMSKLRESSAYVPPVPAGRDDVTQEKIVRSKYKVALKNNKVRDKTVMPTEELEPVIPEQVMTALFNEMRALPVTPSLRGTVVFD